jgi:hypothetical protein
MATTKPKTQSQEPLRNRPDYDEVQQPEERLKLRRGQVDNSHWVPRFVSRTSSHTVTRGRTYSCNKCGAKTSVGDGVELYAWIERHQGESPDCFK